MAILPADHGCSHTGIFPKAVRYRQMKESGIRRGVLSNITCGGRRGENRIKTGQREVTRKTIPGKAEKPHGQGGIQNQDHLSSLVNHSPGFYLRNLIKNRNI